MNVKRLIAGALLATGLLTGCGGVEEQPGDSLQTESSGLGGGAAGCPGEEVYTYYSDATYTQQVGARYCDCIVGKGGWGVVTQYYRYSYDSCPL